MKKFDYRTIEDACWGNDIVRLVSKLHEHKVRQDYFLHHDLSRLAGAIRMRNTIASTRLSGFTVLAERARKLFAGEPPLTEAESAITGYWNALNIIEGNFTTMPLDTLTIRRLHSIILPSLGGRYKTTDIPITTLDCFDRSIIVFNPTPSSAVEKAMNSLLFEYHKVKDIMDSLLLIPIFMSDLFCIHPFSDGNGRLARLLTQLMLFQAGYMVGRFVSIEEMLLNDQRRHDAALFATSDGWHDDTNSPVPYIKYFLEKLDDAYTELNLHMGIIDNSPATELVRRAFTIYDRLYKYELLEILPTVGKKSLERSLKILCDEGYLVKSGAGQRAFYLLASATAGKYPEVTIRGTPKRRLYI